VGVDWSFLLGSPNENIRSEAYAASTIMLFFFVLNLLFSLVSAAFISFQKAYIENIFQATIPLANLISLLLVIEFKGNLESFAYYSGIAMLLINVIKAFTFLILSRRWVDKDKQSHGSSLASGEGYREIIVTGFRFFFMSLAVVLWWNTDNILIAKFLTLEQVATYSITFKLFAIAYALMNMLSASLNPILAKEYGLKNWEWINKVYFLAIEYTSFLGGLICIGTILFSHEVIILWTGEIGYAGLETVVGLAVYTYFLSVNNIDAGIINTCNYVKRISWVYMLSSLIKVIVSVALIQVFGLVGVVLGTLIASALFTSWIFPLWIKKYSNDRIKSRALTTYKNFLFLAPFISISILVSLYIPVGTLEKYLISFILLIIYSVCVYKNSSKEAVLYGKTFFKSLRSE